MIACPAGKRDLFDNLQAGIVKGNIPEEDHYYSSALFYETSVDNPSINSGRFPGALSGLNQCKIGLSFYSFVGV